MGFLDNKTKRTKAAKLAQRDAKKLEQDSNALLKGFKERREAEAQRRKLATDTEYWVCVVFRDRPDKEAFITEFGLDDCPMIPGTRGDKYINGYQLVEKLRAGRTGSGG